MKCSSETSALTITEIAELDTGAVGAYPPFGFLPVAEAALGNGDCFGLYWPHGREGQEPFVCETLHDEWGIRLAFSSVAMFNRFLALNDGEWGEIEVEDPNLPTKRYLATKALFQSQPEQAVTQLAAICEAFPDCSEHWLALASQRRRLGDREGSALAAIRAFASNWALGIPPKNSLKLLQDAKRCSAFADDPLVSRSTSLTLTFGGMSENPDYGILQSCIAEYEHSATPLPGILLHQNYGYLMMRETTAFQERHGFDLANWRTRHIQLCETHLGDSRLRLG